MGEFIKIEIDDQKCKCGTAACANVCPVGIFGVENGNIRVIEENEDECTLCGLCLDACKEGAIKILKLYEK